ncbi:MAG: hypothetical protein JST82_05475 [Bacteroidetes bacterium]|nr:hypothetical protein [Bacteroidota bacterium]
MDNNMINIDDLVRQKLAGGEEKKRPGGWLLMKDLLDKEMPVAVAVGTATNWRRIINAAAMIVVVGGLSIGGYKLYTSINENATAEKPGKAAISANTPGNNNNNNSSSNHSVANTIATNKNNDNQSINKGNVKETPAVKAQSVIQPASGTQNLSSGAKPTRVNNTPKSAPEQQESSLSIASNNRNRLNNNNKNKANETFASGNKVPKKDVKLPQTLNNAGNLHSGDNISKSGNNNPAPQNAYAGTAGTQNTAGNTKPKQPLDPTKTNPRYKKPDEHTDSADFTFIKEKVRRGRITDSIYEGKMAKANVAPAPNPVQLYPLPETEAQFNANPNVVRATEISADEAPMENLASHKTASVFKDRRYRTNRFEEMVKNAKIDFGNVTMHPGLLLGVSRSFGDYGMTGVQAGISGVLSFSEHLSLLTELKGIYRFGNGKSLIHDYNSLGQGVSKNNGVEYKWSSVRQYFNIPSNVSVELPVALRYENKRFNLFAGAGLAYNFSMVGKSTALAVDSQEHVYFTTQSNANGLTSTWDKDNTRMSSESDFSQRFTIGYMVGMGYMFSPAVNLDVRVSQAFWESNKNLTRGKYEVSKALYRVPSLQLVLTYRLAHNANRPMRAR